MTELVNTPITDKNGVKTSRNKKSVAVVTSPRLTPDTVSPSLKSIQYRNDSWRLEEDLSYHNGHMYSEEGSLGYETGMEAKEGANTYRYLINEGGAVRIEFNDHDVLNMDHFPEVVVRSLSAVEHHRNRIVSFNRLRNSM